MKMLRRITALLITAAFFFNAATGTFVMASQQDGLADTGMEAAFAGDFAGDGNQIMENTDAVTESDTPLLVLYGLSEQSFELENGEFTGGVSAASEISGYSGTGYAAGFANIGDAVSFNVEALAEGTYDLVLRSAVYMRNEALGKPATASQSSNTSNRNAKNVTDGSYTNSNYWASGLTDGAEPVGAWLQVDLEEPTLISMARIRIPISWQGRAQTFSLWGGLEEDTLVELKEENQYNFVQGPSNKQEAGNFVDITFNPETVRYVRAVFTGRSDAGLDGYQITQFELFSPIRTAQLHIDGTDSKDINFEVDDTLMGASWEDGVIQWRDTVVSDVFVPMGMHSVSIVADGDNPGNYNLDNITFVNSDIADAVYQMEDGSLSGNVEIRSNQDVIPNSAPVSAYEGDGYVSGFTAPTDSVSFTVDAPATGMYAMSVRDALYLNNIASGKPHSWSRVASPQAGTANITNGVWDNTSHWVAGGALTDPAWVQIDLGQATQISMARLRVPMRFGPRTQTITLLGGNEYNPANPEAGFTVLVPETTYAFAPVGGTTNTTATGEGNYIDIEMNQPNAYRYYRALFTDATETGTDRYHLSSFELYPPVRTAELHVDGTKAQEFEMTPQKFIDPLDIEVGHRTDSPSFTKPEENVPSWRSDAIGEIFLSAGQHTISIVSGGRFPDRYNLDSVTVRLSFPVTDEELGAVISLIAALPSEQSITLETLETDKQKITDARKAYDALTDEKKHRVPNLAKLEAAEMRITLLEAQGPDVEAVISMIDALPLLFKLKLADISRIEPIREAYDLLSPIKQQLVTNFPKLMAAEQRLANTSSAFGIGNMVSYGQNTGDWAARSNLWYTDLAFGDRTFTFTELPEFLIGADWIRPAMEGRGYNADPLVEFDTTVDASLYIAWDSRVTPKPWLTTDGYVKTDLTLSVSQSDGTQSFNIYKRNTPVSSGEHITVGPSGPNNQCPYILILEHYTEKDADNDSGANNFEVITGLVVNDTENEATWNLRQNLQTGDTIYSDHTMVFTGMPEILEGSAWISPSISSGAYSGTNLCEFTVNRDGWLYIAAISNYGWLNTEGFALVSGESIAAADTSYKLYRKHMEAGTKVVLPAQNGTEATYIPIYYTMAIDTIPDAPSISRFVPPFDTAGWYSVRENFDIGAVVYSNNALANIDLSNVTVSALPEEYKGCEYIQTYYHTTDRHGVNFYAERDIEVSLMIDRSSGTLPLWMLIWDNTGTTVTLSNGWEYAIYSTTYPAGTFVQIPQLLASETPKTYFVAIKPVDGHEKKTDNPLVPKGNDTAIDLGYRYYVNEVFNEQVNGDMPTGYSIVKGGAVIASQDEAEPADLAFRRRITTLNQTDTQYNNATDGLDFTYWRATGTDSWLTVSLGRVKYVDRVEISLPSSWNARNHTFSVLGSVDGASYKQMESLKSYQFDPNSDNTVSITLESPAEVKYVRLNFSTVGEVGNIRVFGAETTGVNKYVELSGSAGARAEKQLPADIKERAVFEYKVKSDAYDRLMSVALTGQDGNEISVLTFGADGYLYANDGDSQTQIMPYQEDTWYTVKLITLGADRYELWINHLRKAQSLNVKSSSAVGKLVFSTENNGKISFDNVRVYDYTENYLLAENFKDSATGSTPDGAWTFTQPSAATISDVPFESDKSIQLSAQDVAVKASMSLPQASGIVTFETKVKPMSFEFMAMPVLTDENNRVAAGVAFHHNNLYAVNGDNWVKVLDGESQWSYYPVNNWYKIQITLNTNTKRYDLYVDGALRMKGLSFAEDVNTISQVSYAVLGESTCYINNINMYLGSNPGGGLIDSNNIIDVKAAPYLAKGDGVTDDTEAIQAALDDAAFTGKTVLLEDGVFLTSMITVRSDTTLHVNTGAKILGVQTKYNYPLVESAQGRINRYQVGRGLVFAEGASNIRIEGGGILDGNGLYGYKNNDPSMSRRLQDSRPCVIWTILSEDVVVQNINIEQSAFWTLVPMESTNVTIRNINLNAINNTPNRDGINPCDVVNITIENCNILAGDDALCFKSSSTYGNRNADVRNIMMQSLSNGFKMGTDTYYELKNVTVEDLTIKNLEKSGITLQSTDGADIENISFERIDMSDVDAPIYFTVGRRGRRPNYTDEKTPGTVEHEDPSKGFRMGYIRNISFKDVNFYNHKEYPYSYESGTHESSLIGRLNNGVNRIQNVSFENVYMELPGGNPTPTASIAFPSGTDTGYPEHYYAGGRSNASAYVIRYADNVTFTNCKNVFLQPDARDEYTYADYNAAPVLHDHPIEHVTTVKLQAGRGTQIGSLGLPTQVRAIAGYHLTVILPVTWSPETAYNPNEAGVYRFVGTLTMPEGYENSQSLQAVALVTIGEEQEITVTFDGNGGLPAMQQRTVAAPPHLCKRSRLRLNVTDTPLQAGTQPLTVPARHLRKQQR